MYLLSRLSIIVCNIMKKALYDLAKTMMYNVRPVFSSQASDLPFLINSPI